MGVAFLEFFEGRELTNRRGEAVQLQQRTMSSVTGKFGRSATFPWLRECLAQVVEGTSGDVFMPTITAEVLDAFKRLKAKMITKGVQTETGEFLDSPEWRAFFLLQSSGNDATDVDSDDEGQNDSSVV